MGATDITEPTTATIRGTATLSQPWTLSGKRANQGKGVRIDGSNRHRRAARQGRCDSLVVVHSPLLALSLCEFQKQPRQGRCGNGSNRHHRTTMAKPFRFPCCDSFPSLVALWLFPSVRVPEAARQGRSQQWKQPTSENHKGNGNHHTNGNHQRNARHQGQRRCGNGSNRHHRSTRATIRGTATIPQPWTISAMTTTRATVLSLVIL